MENVHKWFFLAPVFLSSITCSVSLPCWWMVGPEESFSHGIKFGLPAWTETWTEGHSERERESLWPEAVCVLWPSRLSSLRKLMIMTETGSLISARPQRVFSFRFLIHLSFPNPQINRKFFKMKTWQRLEFILNLILQVWEKTRWCFDHLHMFWTPPSLCADLHWQRTYSYVISTCVRTYIWSHSVVPTGRLGVP